MPLLALLLVAPFLYLWQGLVLSLLWGWFMVPAFGLPPLSVPYAIGITIIVAMVAKNRPREDKDQGDWEKVISMVIHGLLTPTIALVFGFVVTLFL